MTVDDIFSYVHNRTKTNTTTAPNSALFDYLNERHRQLWTVLQNVREDYNGEISTTDLVNGQQEYPFPDEAMKIKRIEAKLDGTNWEMVKVFDINERLRPSDSTTVGSDFSKDQPYADIHDSSIFLFPIPDANVTNGLKLWHIRRPQDISLTNVSPELPKEHHMFIVDLMSLDVEVSRGRLSITAAIQATEQVLSSFQARVSPRVFGERVRMKTRRKNYR